MPNKQTKNTDAEKCLTDLERAALENDMKCFGYLLPTNEDELEEFENIFGVTQVMLPESLKNPDFLFKVKSSESKLKPVKKSEKKQADKKKVAKAPIKTFAANAYFKKLVLAAEIATELHNEFAFGHVKFVKVQYLCDQVCNMNLASNYGRYAAGPLDPKLMYSIDAEFIKRKWFKVSKTTYGYKYIPDEKATEYKKYYPNYFGSIADKISFIINLFRKENSDFCEIVATLFAVWKELLEKNQLIDDSALISSFYGWSERKKKI